ncbi:hypothetical protein MEG1DRAFT_03879 [Photorhabdus temperata subsp. temperata Meg1]|uniref:Uncharacterized protein n=1 Tax=Photorhabdus temperata subsp. temperata Meg1 TaxID=1393735 RepID=A0A081RS61_PHOTE|nr:hypothetical protein MEG1DRAFT_03879 [Photorhabdus temperata subsp. temperata Meg1]
MKARKRIPISLKLLNISMQHAPTSIMTREEAERLTMTEFQMMLKAKFPDEKGFTREEYDAVIDADDQRTNELVSGKRRLVSMKK